jgi:hypothetical protein
MLAKAQFSYTLGSKRVRVRDCVLTLLQVFWAKLTKQEGVRPEFTFKADQMPEQIDWVNQKMQIDVAKAAGVKKVVIISSMGGTDRNNFLNTYVVLEAWTACGSPCLPHESLADGPNHPCNLPPPSIHAVHQHSTPHVIPPFQRLHAGTGLQDRRRQHPGVEAAS